MLGAGADAIYTLETLGDSVAQVVTEGAGKLHWGEEIETAR